MCALLFKLHATKDNFICLINILL